MFTHNQFNLQTSSLKSFSIARNPIVKFMAVFLLLLLIVFDANGKTIPAQYTQTQTNNGLYTVVDDTGAASPLIIDLWLQRQKLTASDAAANDFFGNKVAVDGDTVVIGAKGDDDAGLSSGSAYVFVRIEGSWSQQAKLTAIDADGLDSFGNSVAVDGDTAVIGAYYDDDAGDDSGSAYVFVRNGSSWSQQAKLTASDARLNDLFGKSVAVDGDTVVIGADRDDDAGLSSGSAYVFVRNGSSWSQQAKLTASDAAKADHFGVSVAVNGDTAVIGVTADDDDGLSSGSAYVFVRSGDSWSEQAKLTASDAAAEDIFGTSVAIDGDMAVIGAFRDDDSGTDSGSAYVFVRSGDSWSEQAKLTASDAAANDQFGISVAVDGDMAVVGAWFDNDGGADSGSAYVFVRSGSSWHQLQKLKANDAAAYDYFGSSVAVDGDTALIGAYADDEGESASGSIYVYEDVHLPHSIFIPMIVK